MKLNTTSLHLCSLFFFFITTCFWLSSKIINEKIIIVNDCLVHLVIISILQDFTCVDQLIHGMVSCFQLQLFIDLLTRGMLDYRWSVFLLPLLVSVWFRAEIPGFDGIIPAEFPRFFLPPKFDENEIIPSPAQTYVFRFCLESTYLIPGIEVSDRYDVLCDDRKEDRSLRL